MNKITVTKWGMMYTKENDMIEGEHLWQERIKSIMAGFCELCNELWVLQKEGISWAAEEFVFSSKSCPKKSGYKKTLLEMSV